MHLLKFENHPKGWGHEDWIINLPEYCAKILVVEAGKQCSLHFHKLKTETMLLVSGRIEFSISKPGFMELSIVELSPGDAIHIEPLALHRFRALENSVIHEFSTEHFESDSYRVEKGD